MISDTKFKLLLIDNGSVSPKLLEIVTKRFELVHVFGSASGIDHAKNRFEPDAILVDLPKSSETGAVNEPRLLDLWVVDQIRDIPVCFDIPIAVVSKWNEEGVQKQQFNALRCRYFHLDAVEETLKYLTGGPSDAALN